MQEKWTLGFFIWFIDERCAAFGLTCLFLTLGACRNIDYVAEQKLRDHESPQALLKAEALQDKLMERGLEVRPVEPLHMDLNLFQEVRSIPGSCSNCTSLKKFPYHTTDKRCGEGNWIIHELTSPTETEILCFQAALFQSAAVFELEDYISILEAIEAGTRGLRYPSIPIRVGRDLGILAGLYRIEPEDILLGNRFWSEENTPTVFVLRVPDTENMTLKAIEELFGRWPNLGTNEDAQAAKYAKANFYLRLQSQTLSTAPDVTAHYGIISDSRYLIFARPFEEFKSQPPRPVVPSPRDFRNYLVVYPL